MAALEAPAQRPDSADAGALAERADASAAEARGAGLASLATQSARPAAAPAARLSAATPDAPETAAAQTAGRPAQAAKPEAPAAEAAPPAAARLAPGRAETSAAGPLPAPAAPAPQAAPSSERAVPAAHLQGAWAQPAAPPVAALSGAAPAAQAARLARRGAVRAEASPPPAAPVEAAPARPAATAASSPTAAPVRVAAIRADAAALPARPALPAEADPVPARPALPAAPAAEARPPAEAPVAAASPSADAASTAEPRGAAAPDAPARGDPAPNVSARGAAPPAAPAQGEAAPSAPARGEALSVAAAWAGDASAQLDAQSIATIAAFLIPGAPLPDAEARDAVSAALASIPCARLEAAFSPETGGVALRGHAPSEALRAEAVARMRAAVGGAIPVADDLLVLPAPQCAVLESVDAAGLPQSTDQADDPLVVGRAAEARRLSLTEGASLVFDLEAPDYPAYVYLDYYDAGGTVTHLAPSVFAPTRRFEPAERIVLGGTAPGVAAWGDLRLTVQPPFGKDIAVVIGTTAPLHQGDRPLTEPAAPYLEWLRGRIAALSAADPEFRGEWAYVFVETGPAP